MSFLAVKKVRPVAFEQAWIEVVGWQLPHSLTY